MYASLREIHPYVGTKKAVVQLQSNMLLDNSGTQHTQRTPSKHC